MRDNLSFKSPVYTAFSLYNNFVGRPAWDQTAVLLLDQQANYFFSVVTKGHMKVNLDGSNEWLPNTTFSYRHSYIKIKPDVDPKEIATYIDNLTLAAEK